MPMAYPPGQVKNEGRPQLRKYCIMKPTRGQWHGASGRRTRVELVMASCGQTMPGQFLLTEQPSYRHRQGWLPGHLRLFIPESG